MVGPIRKLSLNEFIEILRAAQLSRRIDAVHVHHTWRPRRIDFRGLATVEAMRRHHMEVNGWSDIAQHLTIDPAGGLWTGRNWNAAPASSAGRNGTSAQGPFMIEMVGDFDQGRDPFDGPQKEAAIATVAALLTRFKLKNEAIKFHCQLGSPKTCPGTSIDHAAFVKEVAKARADGVAKSSAAGAGALLDRSDVARAIAPGTEPASAEVPENEGAAGRMERMAEEGLAQRRARRGWPPASRAARSGDSWNDLALHVVNLSRGELSEGGEFDSTPADLDAIVDGIRAYAESNPKPRLVLHAHGGLVSEVKALEYARAMRPWWERHGVYPVFFVWETGLVQTITQFLAGPRAVTDPATDLTLELLGKIPGTALWSGMKESARRASSPDASDGNPGGAWLFAQRLRAMLVGAGAPKLSIHAVGHSAGAIFHSHLLPLLVELELPIATLALLAPAARTSLFRKKLLDLVKQKKIRKLSLFTMEEDAELQDNVGKVYRKSLLYFVSRACEGPARASILGLHRAIQKQDDLHQLFGLESGAAAGAELQLSFAPGNDPNPLTQALRHGDFDNDRFTMSAVLRRILGVSDDLPIGQDDFPFELEERAFPRDQMPEISSLVLPAVPPAIVAGAKPASGKGDDKGRRLALCIGIDKYQQRPLSGCVNDARTWARTLEGLGFSVTTRFDEAATRQAIVDDMTQLVEGSRSGDVLVLQYSGHGTQFNDLNGDEADPFDEAFVPFDYHTGAYLLDDDIGEVLSRLPSGVVITLFMDCCHSGTNSKAAPPPRSRDNSADRARFLPATREMEEAHRRFRASHRSSAPRSSEEALPGVIHLAACQDQEFAWESGGQGDFTAVATRLLAASVGRGDQNEKFLEDVRAEVIAKARQHPMLMKPAAGMAGLTLLAPLTAGSNGARPTTDNATLLGHVEAMERILRRDLGNG